MRKNIGRGDRLLRFSMGMGLLAMAWWLSSWIALGFALFTFYEALVGWCAFYQMIGRDSCPK